MWNTLTNTVAYATSWPTFLFKEAVGAYAYFQNKKKGIIVIETFKQKNIILGVGCLSLRKISILWISFRNGTCHSTG